MAAKRVVDYDVNAYQGPTGKWHWEAEVELELLDLQQRTRRTRGALSATCCMLAGSTGNICLGYEDKESAEEAAWKRVSELESR